MIPDLRSFVSLARRRPDRPEPWRAWRDAQLRDLIGDAVARCPYYRELFRVRAISPSAIRTADDLRSVPLLDRDTVRVRARDLVRQDLRPEDCQVVKTTGTTGEPTVMYCTRREVAFQHGLWVSGYLREGLRPWHRQAKFLMAHNIPGRSRAFQRAGLFRRAYLSVSAPTVEKLHWLRALRPDALFTWGSILNELWHHLERDRSILEIPLIFSTSDTVWADQVRTRIAGRLVMIYGSIETGPVAWSCPSGDGYHVDPRWAYFEIVDDDGRPARRGHVVCTPFWRSTMPLIRYKLGDLAEWIDAPCGCGSTLPRIGSLIGRQPELIRLPHGEHRSGAILGEAMRPIPGIVAYQFAQRSETESFLFIVPGPDYVTDTEDRLRRYFADRFGSEVTVHIKRVSALYRPPGEKYRAVYPLSVIERMRNNAVDVERIFAQ